MDNAPEAAAAAPQAPETEATPTTNPEPAQAPAPAQAPDMHGFTSEQLADIDKFFKANGGFDAIKSKISNPVPAPKEEPKVAEPAQPAQPAAPVQQPAPQKQEGYLSPTDIAYIQYSRLLASDPKYQKLGDYISNGNFIDEMKALGINPVDTMGNVNDGNIRRFLDLKAQTIPAEAPTTPAASAKPTVNYIEVGEAISSRDQALAVMGQVGHPMHDKAVEYLRNEIFNGGKPPVEKK